MLVDKSELESIINTRYHGFYKDVALRVNKKYGASYSPTGIRQHLTKKEGLNGHIRIPNIIMEQARALLKEM